MWISQGKGRSAEELAVNVSRAPASATVRVSSLEARFLMTKVFVGVLIGLCAGALVGGLAIGGSAADTTATAFLRLQNPADLTAIAGGASQITPDNQDGTTQYVAGEISYLSGEGFAQAVSRKMAKDEPLELKVIQENESSIVTVSCSSATSDEARRTVQTAIDIYGQELEQRGDEHLRTILPTLSEWQQRDGADPARVNALQQLRESVELQAAEASTLLVVQPPVSKDPSSQQWVVGALVGALVGGACGAAVVLARRRRAGGGSVVKAVTDGVDGVLVPAVDLDMPPRDEWGDDQDRLARTLYAQCPSAGPARVILVVGTSASSGSSVVASLLEIAVAATRSIAPTTIRSGQHSLHSSDEPATTQVVDGGAIGDPTLTPDVIGAATDVVLVARIASDTVAHAELALHAAAGAGTASVVAVFTYRRRHWGSFRKMPTPRLEESA